MAEENIRIMRVDKKIAEEAKRIAQSNKMSLKHFVDEALTKQIEVYEYNFEALIKIVEESPTLQPHKEVIQKEMAGCPLSISKDVIQIIKGRDSFVLEGSPEEITKELSKVDTKKMYGFFLHISLKDISMEKIQKIMDKVNKTLSKNIINKIGVRKSEEDKILLFLSYKKESEKNGKA
ncbi:MAG: hypothetical protein JSW08_02245 [archaeon]|nr:MAG: hypothetical protein JSW08_02245 [archaeon]